jgi:membrane protease YdiL (CAAX protease family)
MWKRNFKPIGTTYYTHDWCEYKRPAFFVAFAAIVALLQINIVTLELFSVTSVSSSGGMPEGFFGFLFSLVAYCVIPAMSEELFSRGVLMRVGGFGIRAAVLSGVIFGLCHFNPYQLIYSVGAGIVLSFLFLYTDDIRLTMLLHFVVNAVVLVLSYLAQICSVGLYVAIECVTWLAVLSVGVYFSWVILRDHQRALNEKTEDIKKNKADVTVSEIFSPAMIVVYAVIVVATVLRMVL